VGEPQISPDAPAAGPEDAEPEAGTPQLELETRLAEALAEAEKLRADWLRAKAETENTRRRGQDDVAKAHRFGIESFAAALLGVSDGLEAALAIGNPTLESFREGVELTSRQLESVFEKFAIRPVAPQAGEKFDPHRHQAISQVASSQEPNTIVAVLQKGFLLHERVLRPALVIVASAREAAEDRTPDAPGAIDNPPQ
jgi:molecular chaperone GrpE